MGFRFRKSISLGKGLRLNLGKTGGSFSLGGKGATVNLGKRGVRTTIGIPGTGISYTTPTSSSNLDKIDFDPLSAPVSWSDKLLLWLQLGMASIQLIFDVLAFLATCVVSAFVLYILFLAFRITLCPQPLIMHSQLTKTPTIYLEISLKSFAFWLKIAFKTPNLGL